MGTIITVASQKGGVGKTTSAVNLAASLTLAHQEVLLVDLDPQGNASSGVGVEPGRSPVLSQSLGGDGDLRPLVSPTCFEHLSVLASSAELSHLDLIHSVQTTGLRRFRDQLATLAADFDYVLLDCPPSLGGLPTIALASCRWVLIPIQCEYYAMEGLSQILPIIKKIQNDINHDLEIGGLLLTMYSDELELSQDVLREVKGYFGDQVFESIVPRDVVLAEASSHGQPVYFYAPLSRGAWSYIELAKEVLEHGWA